MADPQERVYLEFLNYDWATFPEFQEGLAQILDGHLESLKEKDPHATQIPPADKQQLVDQAKSFYFCSQTGHILNLDDFYAWKRNNGGKITLLGNEHSDSEHAGQTSVAAPEAPQETPYSSNYQHLVELIVSGKPVPGIKQIPDTVLSGQESKSQAPMRTKPWEKKTEAEPQEEPSGAA
ncbi:hypothetical protein EJF18_60249 [Clavispora lusitaniae]|uniref:Uncharacterized protein n=1 Tax=Clavispora lusitaniae TaxID=36911 RepID=A0ACD0WRV1_CLALS|nr:hypothetical protein EJF14_60249 [Clavispora lusitaniae]QFZ35387.1 hypothetical protein EJF16_60249 [Clavispora lusitaniae]QFZ41081.1 hypothetical protein EJF15_60249 [Clavispora lusitaniae]QFZ46762.1 hypothetical protein EJF18_60249 [Clavispora lusitaniae]QFZ52427.1 hypothetical protein EJF17_60249 [Clavispora lusitaniae]